LSREWPGDNSLSWSIALRATLDQTVDASGVEARLQSLASVYPDIVLPEFVTRGTDIHHLVAGAFEPGGSVLRVDVAENQLTVAAHHSTMDGLGLLALMGELTRRTVETDVRGLAGRREQPVLRAAASRLIEAAVRPSATVAKVGERAGLDALATADLGSMPRTTDLVLATAGAVAAWNTARGERPSRVAVAIGTSLVSGAGTLFRDDSTYLRLRDVERLSADAVRYSLRNQPPEPVRGGGLGTSKVVSRVTALVSRRLGSTVLVSHLGHVTAPGVRRLEFHPVAGGRSGVALGAASINGRTTLTLRARGGEQTDDSLADLLSLVVDRLQ
jgi:hypothetical protein